MSLRRREKVLLSVLVIVAVIAAPCVDAGAGPRRTLQQAPGSTALSTLFQGVGSLMTNVLKSVSQLVLQPLSVPSPAAGVKPAGTTAAPTGAANTTVTPSPTPTSGPRYSYTAILHNVEREKHQATPDVMYNAGLETTAQNYANKCMFQHSGTPGLGENLYMISGPVGSLPSEGQVLADAVVAWYDEIASYDYAQPGYSEATGHFTQVVWASTASIGCGISFCADQVAGVEVGNESYLVVCEYSPAGNVNTPQEFAANVKPLKSASQSLPPQASG